MGMGKGVSNSKQMVRDKSTLRLFELVISAARRSQRSSEDYVIPCVSVKLRRSSTAILKKTSDSF